MITDQTASSVLIFRATCRKCRWLSWIAVVTLYGTMRRIPHDSSEAKAILRGTHEKRLKVTVVHRGRVYSGVGAISKIGLLFSTNWWKRIARVLVTLTQDKR